MNLTTLAFFIPACFALNMVPGPNNLLSLSNATRYGFKNSCLGGLGRIVAFTVMIALAATGLAVVLHTSEVFFNIIKAVGTVYLFYLAIQFWRAKPTSFTTESTLQIGAWGLARQEFLVAAGNPKAILIFTAFLPQFVQPTEPAMPQFAVLGALFLVMELVAIAIYAYAGLHMRRFFANVRSQRIFNRICAVLLASAGVGLLLSRRGR